MGDCPASIWPYSSAEISSISAICSGDLLRRSRCFWISGPACPVWVSADLPLSERRREVGVSSLMAILASSGPHVSAGDWPASISWYRSTGIWSFPAMSSSESFLRSRSFMRTSPSFTFILLIAGWAEICAWAVDASTAAAPALSECGLLQKTRQSTFPFGG
jgi:hypothetical protein